jgi:acetyl esterase
MRPAHQRCQREGVKVTTVSLRHLLGLPPAAITRLAGEPATINGVALDPSVHLLLWMADRIGGSRAQDVDLRRAGMRKNAELVMPAIGGVEVSEHQLAGRIQVRVYRAHRKPAPLLMYLHGGGWVVGDLDTHDGTCRMLALHSDCVVVSIDYALAPEHPFPAGLDDALTAFDALCDSPELWGALPGPVAVAGDSAVRTCALPCACSENPWPPGSSTRQ